MSSHNTLRVVVGWLICVVLSFAFYFSLSFLQLRYGELGQFYSDSQIMNEHELRGKYGDLWEVLAKGWLLDDWVFLPLTALLTGVVAAFVGVRRPGLLAAISFSPLGFFLLVTTFDSRTILFLGFYLVLTFVSAQGAALLRRAVSAPRHSGPANSP